MIIARIEFKPEYACDFIDSEHGTQTIIQVAYASPEDMIKEIKQIEPYIKDCIAVVNGRMLCLSSFTAK
jgi:hypothetical protein